MIKKITVSFFCCVAFISVAYTAHAQTWKQLNDKVSVLYKAGNIDSAIYYATKLKAKTERKFGKINDNYTTSLNNLAILYKKIGNYEMAEPLSTEAIDIQKKMHGTQNRDYAESLNNLGILYYNMGNYAKAEPLFVVALAIRKKKLGTENPDYVTSLSNLAILYRVIGQYSKAEPLFVEAIAIKKKTLGTANPEYAASLTNMARLYNDMGNYTKAEPLFVEAIAIQKKTVGTENPEYAAYLNDLAVLYNAMGNYAKAEQLYIQYMAVTKKVDGAKHLEYANSLNNLGTLYGIMGNYTKAEQLYLEAIAIVNKALGKENRDYTFYLNNLASLYKATDDYAKAEPLYVEALSIRKKIHGTENRDYAKSLVDLAGLYKGTGDFAKAEQLYLEAGAIIKKTEGSEHPDYAYSLNDLAALYDIVGDYAKAEPLYLEVLSISKKVFGSEHPDYATFLNNLARLYRDMGNYTKAEPFFLQANTIRLQNISKSFGFLSEDEKERYVATISDDFEDYQSFLRNYQQLKPSTAAESYDIELSTKGIILSSDIQLGQSIRGSHNREAIGLFDHWTGLKSSLAKAYSMPIAMQQLNTDSIVNLANSDEKELTKLSVSFRNGKLLRQADWKKVQQELDPSEVAIEFASFHDRNYKRRTDTVLYSALVLRKGDAYPAMVNLCRQDQLDSLLNKGGSTQGTFIGNLYRGATISSTDTSAATHQELYKLVWKPIEKLLHKGDHIYYAPSGLLHQVAFAAIRRDDGTLLSDRYQLTQVSSTAMLLQPAPAIDTKNLSVTAFGGIQYDASQTELASLAAKDTQRYVSRFLLPDSARGGTSFEYLNGTLTEINSIDSLGKQYHVPITLYSGANAMEGTYKRFGTGPSPGIIHIATHGFFFPDPKKVQRNNTGLLSGENQQFTLSDNPLNRAGLAFAGANHAWKGEAIPPGTEDGILTAYEASNVPLSSTQLVVLSACETGLGDIKGSEGVFGLQRAFKAAGATYIMMSLWQVPDKETAEFMKYFYKGLFSGETIEKAFTSAQTTMKNKYRDDPYKWAAFVLMR